MITNLRALLSLHEGRKNVPYLDSEQLWTAGVGHLIDRRRGGTLHASWRAFPLTELEIDIALDDDIDSHSKALIAVQPWVVNLDAVRKAVMFDMTFNLGVEPFDHDGFKDWPMFVEQVRTGQWVAAAANMRKTTWAGQVGARAVRLAKMMEDGKWPEA